jgi:hypothetical protein
LVSIVFGNTANSIEYQTFINETQLTTVQLSDTITNIGDCAFLDCHSLTYVEIPESVTYIGYDAFKVFSQYGGNELTAVIHSSTPIEVGNNPFGAVPGDQSGPGDAVLNIYVPQGSLGAYVAEEQWAYYYNAGCLSESE